MADEECHCEFDPYEGEDAAEESVHFKRICPLCGQAFWSLHCRHESPMRHCLDCRAQELDARIMRAL